MTLSPRAARAPTPLEESSLRRGFVGAARVVSVALAAVVAVEVVAVQPSGFVYLFVEMWMEVRWNVRACG